MKERKISLINGLYSNGNIEGKDIAQKESELEDNFERAINQIYSNQFIEEEEKLEDNPFFKPAMKAQKERDLKLGIEDKDAETLRDIADLDVDQVGE